MQKVSESLVGFAEESTVSADKVNDLADKMLASYRRLRDTKKPYTPPAENPADA